MQSTTLEPGRILVVDDNEMNRDMLIRRLLRQGHTVDFAVNGRHALEILEAADFDLVLLDIMMPELNGYEVLEHLRADERLSHLPVILISALDDTESVIQGIKHGADDHLPKPFNPHILRARVDACLAKKRLHDRAQLHARALEREIDIAREIQAGFLPDQLPAHPGWDLAARFHPARTVAGDFYDVFPLGHASQPSHLVFVVADVCDKGVGAALFMALFRTLLRALAERTLTNQTLASGPGLADAVRQLMTGVNDYIARTHAQANMFATIFLGCLDLTNGELLYVNGGHEAAVITGKDGIRATLPPTGPAVGMLPGLAFQTARETIAPGELLVSHTDGVIDALDPAGNDFSEPRLLALLETPATTADDALDRIEAAVADHAGQTTPFDDITLFALRRLAPPPPPG